MLQSLTHIDNVIVLAYFSVVLAVGLSSSRRKDGNSTMYFLSGRELGWFSIGASLIAADTLCGHVVGISGPFGRVLAADLEMMGIVGLVILGWSIGPKYIKMRSFTVTDFLGNRYSSRVGTYVSFSYVAAYLLTRLSLVLFMGAFLIRQVSDSDLYVTIVALVLISGIYSIAGGFSAVVNTQIFQTVIMLAGFIAFMFGIAGGDSPVHVLGNLATNSPAMSSVPQTDSFPWIGLIVGIPLLALWLWLSDQYMVQHIFGARSRSELKKGTAFVAAVKAVVILALLVSGFLIPSGSPSNPEPFSIPSFYRGIVLIGIFAAMMSSLSGLFNSTSALFTLGMYKKRNPGASERKLVLVGRLSTTAAVVVALLWMSLLSIVDWQGSGALQGLFAYFAAIVAAILISSVAWKRVTSSAALSALLVGGAAGITRSGVEILFKSWTTDNPVITWLTRTHYLNFASLIFLICILVIATVSLVAPVNRPAATVPQVHRNS